MVNVPIQTQMFGLSHISTDTKASGLTIKTIEGLNFFKKKNKMLKVAEEAGTVNFYKQFLETEYHNIDRELSDFLRDDVMARKYKMDESDKEGWAIYYTMLDKYNICRHFLGIK